MTTTIRRGGVSTTTPSQRLRTSFAAVRVSFTWLGVRKSLSADQKAQAAEPFGAEGQYLTAAKKLLDTSHEAFQQVTAIRNRITSFWKGMSLPYPESGVRLVKQDEVQRFDHGMSVFRDELRVAVENLDGHYHGLKAAAQEQLGRLYNPQDYPATLRGMFCVEWDFPNVDPPEYLLRLNPHLYQQERDRIASRFNEAVKLAEEAFTAEFSKLVSHLVERLSGGEDGGRKVFRDSAISNLSEFFQRFKSLNVRSNADLDRLVETAQRTIQGVDPQAIRDRDDLRQHVATQMSTVQSVLDGMMVDQPRRRILRTQRKEG